MYVLDTNAARIRGRRREQMEATGQGSAGPAFPCPVPSNPKGPALLCSDDLLYY